jgi:hypothetical protein
MKPIAHLRTRFMLGVIVAALLIAVAFFGLIAADTRKSGPGATSTHRVIHVRRSLNQQTGTAGDGVPEPEPNWPHLDGWR